MKTLHQTPRAIALNGYLRVLNGFALAECAEFELQCIKRLAQAMTPPTADNVLSHQIGVILWHCQQQATFIQMLKRELDHIFTPTPGGYVEIRAGGCK